MSCGVITHKDDEIFDRVTKQILLNQNKPWYLGVISLLGRCCILAARADTQTIIIKMKSCALRRALISSGALQLIVCSQ